MAVAAMAVLFAGSSLAVERVGWITDEKCANAGKSAGEDHAKCAQGCVKGGEAIVFLDERSGRVVKIKNPEKAQDFVGKKVTVDAERIGQSEIEINSVKE
jgi:hypothetical protein